jgi:hypothetical protein
MTLVRKVLFTISDNPRADLNHESETVRAFDITPALMALKELFRLCDLIDSTKTERTDIELAVALCVHSLRLVLRF